MDSSIPGFPYLGRGLILSHLAHVAAAYALMLPPERELEDGDGPTVS